MDSRGRTIFVADARRGENQRLIVPANEKLTTELAIRAEPAVVIGWLDLKSTFIYQVLEDPNGPFDSIRTQNSIFPRPAAASPIFRSHDPGL